MRKRMVVAMVSLGWMVLAGSAFGAKPAAKPAAAPAGAQTLPAYTVGTSVQNMVITYNRQMNAQARYTDMAAQAQKEGYRKVAKLFTGAAMSEGIQAAAIVKTLSAMKITVKAGLTKTAVGTTKSNLQAVVAEENQETGSMIPAFLNKAEAEKKNQAKGTLLGALAVEKSHAKLFAEALANLAAWKADGDIFVCQVCGNVVEKVDFEYCPICKASAGEFKKM